MGNQRKSRSYDEFVDKFKPRHTTDDCFTPANIYAVVLDWSAKKYGFDPAKAVRPFCPGGDYQAFDYAPDAVVVDNPPFSIVSQIVKWYNDHGIRFFLFCPGLTAFRVNSDKRSTILIVDVEIKYDNGARVNTAFVTNMEGDVFARTCRDLKLEIKSVVVKTDNRVFNHDYPNEVITASKMFKFVDNTTPFVIHKNDIEFKEKLDCGIRTFGGALILSERASKKRADAEREAKKRTMAERKKYHVIKLSRREKALQRSLGK